MEDFDKLAGPIDPRTRAERNAILVDPNSLCLLNLDRAAWYETEEEVEAGLAWGKRKAELLRWVRRRMGRKLTLRERRCVELYFFEGKTLREVGTLTGTTASSSHRAVRRALRKLQEAAVTDGKRTESAKPRKTTNRRRGTGPRA